MNIQQLLSSCNSFSQFPPLYTSFKPACFNVVLAMPLRCPDAQQQTTGRFICLIRSVLAAILSTGILMEPGILPRSYSLAERTSIITAPWRKAFFIAPFPKKEKSPIPEN